MTTIHLDPTTSHTTASELTRSAQMLNANLSLLRSAWNNLDPAWQGGGKESFASGMEACLRTLTTREEDLLLLVARLEREIDEWEETDRKCASGWKSNQWDLAWLRGQLPVSAGGSSSGWDGFTAIMPLASAISISALIGSLPLWLQTIIDHMFPPTPIILPIPDGEQPTQQTLGVIPTTTEPSTPEASPSAQVQNPPEKIYDIQYDVPIQSQGILYGNHGCSLASVSMVLGYLYNQDNNNKTISGSDLEKMMDTTDGSPKTGISLSNLTDELNTLGYNHISSGANANMDDLESQLKNGPVIVTTGVAITNTPRTITGSGSVIHAMVVKGIGSEFVLVNDPWSGTEMKISRTDFEKMWSKGSNGYYSILP